MAKKLKYPKKSWRIKVPVMITEGLEAGEWEVFFLEKDGSTKEKAAIAKHLTAESCWIICRAYNDRLKDYYSRKDIKKIIKSFKDGKKEQKSKKTKKSKKGSSKSKAKGGKKK